MFYVFIFILKKIIAFQIEPLQSNLIAYNVGNIRLSIETNIEKRKENIKNDEIRSKGKHLIFFAWGIEIIAASIGLFFALVRIISAVEQNEVMSASLWFDALIGALPFVAISLVELTKIPFVTAFYYAETFVWKSVFFLGIMILMIVTFETFFTGFERSWASINNKISTNMNEMNNLRAEIKTGKMNVNDEDNPLSESRESLRNNMTTRKNGVNEEHKNLIKTIQDDIDFIQKSASEDSSPLYAQKEYKKSQIEKILATLKQAIVRQDAILKSNISLLREASNKNIELLKENFNNDQKTANNNLERIDKRVKEIGISYEKNKLTINTKENLAEKVYSNAKTLADNTYNKSYAECDYSCESRHGPIRDKSKAEAKNIYDNKISKYAEEKVQDFKRYNDAINSEKADKDKINAGQGSSITDQATKLNSTLESKINSERIANDNKINNLENASQSQIYTLQEDIIAIDIKLIEVINIKDPQTTIRIVNKKDQIDTLRLQQKSRLDEIQTDYLKRLKDFKDQEQNKKLSILDIEEKKRELDIKCKELEEKVLTNQVYRLSKLIGGKDIACAEDFYPSLRLTFVIWFGSLSLIIAGTGSLLAMGGLVLLDPPQKTKNSPVPFSRALRRLFVAYRKKLIKPKIITEKVEVVKEVPIEVIKEVPVDKIVFKDVPKEIIRKEIVHVPLYTNDKRLLNEEELDKSKVKKSKVKEDPMDKNNAK